jgi:negative regulator of replication initiation
MDTIEVDFDVYKSLTCRRRTREMSYNDVLRELLNLPPANPASNSSDPIVTPSDWVCKGVRFPARTEFRATYRGQAYHGKVEAGALVINGNRFTSPSSAAVAITKNPVNGWMFWECRLPGTNSWQTIKLLRTSR